MKQVVKETSRYMWRNEKNRLFMGIATLAVLLYSFIIVPHISGENEINVAHLERDMNGNVIQFEQALEDGLIVPNSLTGTTAYHQLRREYVAQREVLTALKHGDVRRYIAASYRPAVNRTDFSAVEQLIFRLFGYELEQAFQPQKNEAYLTEVEQLNFHVVHDRTSLQQISLFLIGLGPILLLIGLIFLISDVHVKDRLLETQKIGHPMPWHTYTWVQAMTAFGFVTVFFLGLALLFFIVQGLQYGFGTFTLPTGFYAADAGVGVFNMEKFQLRTIGELLLRALPYVILLGYLFTRINTLFSLWTKQTVVTMALGIFLVVFQFLYYGADTSELLGIPIKHYPQTYFDFGKVITGRLELQIGEAIPDLYSHGLLVLGSTIVIVELLLIVSSKKITRQQYVN